MLSSNNSAYIIRYNHVYKYFYFFITDNRKLISEKIFSTNFVNIFKNLQKTRLY